MVLQALLPYAAGLHKVTCPWGAQHELNPAKNEQPALWLSEVIVSLRCPFVTGPIRDFLNSWQSPLNLSRQDPRLF